MSRILTGDCLEVLKKLDSNSADSLVTDPPAGISFMGKDWDHHKGGRKEWIEWMASVMRECERVLKPGAHALVWAIPRTSHWTATACEEAGFEIRDVVTHLFGSGFPKSLDVSKAMDKAAGLERARIPGGQGGKNTVLGARKSGEAKQWSGWGTALKPASEHWILCRKPLSEKTVAKNVEKWGCGALNIDASRVASPGGLTQGGSCKGESALPMNKAGGLLESRERSQEHTQGRFPANLVLSHSDSCVENQCSLDCAVRELDRQSGTLKSGAKKTFGKGFNASPVYGDGKEIKFNFDASQGGASRFFYVAKASKKDKNAGCDLSRSQAVGNRPKSGDSTGKFPDHDQRERVGNFHPTVKSTQLMTYLIRMITPPGGLVLDPFAGSGTTGVAALRSGFEFIGIERDKEYAAIAKKRCRHAEVL